MADQMRRTAIHGFQDFGDIAGQIMQSCAIERAATLSNSAHVNGDGLEPSDSERVRQIVKIAGAAASISEQHDRTAGTVKGAFECRAADFDVSVLMQSYLPVYPRTG
jgi:hypothetical protein